MPQQRSPILLKPAHFDLPMRPVRLFGREAPLVLEIGFGGGRLLKQLATDRPDWNLLGVELSHGSTARAFRRLQRAGVRNARLFTGRARFVVRDVLLPRTLHRIYVNFPDPWPKERHHDRRLLNASFFRLAATRLEEGGALLLTTDHEDYFRFAITEAQTTGCYQIGHTDPPPAMLQTKYARRWRGQDKPIHHAVFTKRAEPDDTFEPIIQKSPMHHAVLEGELPDLHSFEKQVHKADDVQIVLLEAYRSVEGDGLLFLTLVEEPDLSQKILVEARPGRRGIFVGLKRFGDPISTTGTSEAVRLVTEWLENQGLEAVDRKY